MELIRSKESTSNIVMEMFEKIIDEKHAVYSWLKSNKCIEHMRKYYSTKISLF